MTSDVPSPCINVCHIDEPSQRCLGCDRSIEEITQWIRMDNEAKQAVIDGIIERRQQKLTGSQKIQKPADD